MSSVYMQHHDDAAPCTCVNCDTTTPFGKLDSIDDIEERLSPGDIVPAGECPECGCLAYLDTPDAERLLIEALDAMMRVQSKRRHPLGAPDEGIAYAAADAMDKARRAMKAAGQSCDGPEPPKVWTVLLSRPDYIAEDQFDTYMTHVEAENTMHALLKAQKEAYEHDYDEDERAEGIGAAADYRPLLVIEGKHMDVKP